MALLGGSPSLPWSYLPRFSPPAFPVPFPRCQTLFQLTSGITRPFQEAFLFLLPSSRLVLKSFEASICLNHLLHTFAYCRTQSTSECVKTCLLNDPTGCREGKEEHVYPGELSPRLTKPSRVAWHRDSVLVGQMVSSPEEASWEDGCRMSHCGH